MCYVQLNINKTGGGPEQKSELDDVQLRAIDICTGQYEPLPNPADDDAGFHLSVAAKEQEIVIRLSMYII